jgi:hypothetical protein
MKTLLKAILGGRTSVDVVGLLLLVALLALGSSPLILGR